MTTATHETLTESVARQLRGKLAEHRISQKQLSEMTGWSAMFISRRCSGETPINVRDMEMIEAATGISIHSLLPRVDSNHQPLGLRSKHRLACTKHPFKR